MMNQKCDLSENAERIFGELLEEEYRGQQSSHSSPANTRYTSSIQAAAPR